MHPLRQVPTPTGTIKNLEFLLLIRHEIEHKSTNRIDDALSAKLRLAASTSTTHCKTSSASSTHLKRRLPIALQFVTFNPDQRGALKKAPTLPQHVETMMDTFYSSLKPEELADPRFAFRVAFILRSARRLKRRCCLHVYQGGQLTKPKNLPMSS